MARKTKLEKPHQNLDLMQWMLLIYLVHLITCHAQASLAEVALHPRDIDTSITGNYLIRNCQRINHSTQLQQLIQQMLQALRLVLADLEQGTASRHGFHTFFRSNANIPVTRQVFRAMAAGRNVTAGKQPVIECASPAFYTPQQLQVFNQFCHPPGQVPPGAAALPLQGTVVLCPVFWELPVDVPSERHCAVVTGRRGRRQFVDDGHELRDSQLATLVHELVHVYNPLDGASKRAEVYDIRELSRLDKDLSVANAENWAVYAASVTAGCTRFPLPPIPVELKA
ncbi:MAG: hypothetical protein Q9173_003578 [Seirophora scorigena]